MTQSLSQYDHYCVIKKCKTGPKSVDQLPLIESISLVSCVDELDQLPIRSGVATGVANE